MQLDFHFYTIYVLCRCNGMSPKASKTVAYSSQHTDDAKYEHPLEFENGGRFHQVLSAHKFIDPDVFSLDSQYRIYVPFHFIPANQGGRFQERMVCKENSEIVQEMVRATADLKGKPYQLHRLGIALHVYADTWSHRDFSGLKTELNDIEDIDVLNDTAAGILRSLTNWFRNFSEALIPQIGHAEATKLPDEPYREWKFRHVYKDELMHRKNWEECLKASKAIYEQIEGFLAKNPEYRTESPIPWDSIRDTIEDMFKKKGSLEERCGNWAKGINASAFGFPCQPEEQDLSYHDREWFQQAVEVNVVDNKEQYIRKDGFHQSDWKHFHDAAASHRFLVLQELLSPEGIICG